MNLASAANSRINLNELSINEKIQLIKTTYSGESYFQELYGSDQVEIDCSKPASAFRHEIERLLLERKLIQEPIQLERLHEVMSSEMRAYGLHDGVNKISTFFYDTDAQFEAVYFEFIKFLRENFLSEPFFFQATPTIRIHCPNAENSHHYPRYHSDISYGHPPEEINIWFPLTEIMNGHGFRAMTVENSNVALQRFNFDFSAFIESAIENKSFSNYCDTLSEPVNTPLGRMFAFDPRCIHTGEPLKEHTRVSMDIRIVPVSQYKKMTIQYQGSGRRKILFEPGHCYHELDSDQFLIHKGI